MEEEEKLYSRHQIEARLARAEVRLKERIADELYPMIYTHPGIEALLERLNHEIDVIRKEMLTDPRTWEDGIHGVK